VLARRPDHQRPLGLVTRPGAQRGAWREAAPWIVGTDVDDDFAGDAVRLDDPADYEIHAESDPRVASLSSANY
jgi:hypothetical protein